MPDRSFSSTSTRTTRPTSAPLLAEALVAASDRSFSDHELSLALLALAESIHRLADVTSAVTRSGWGFDGDVAEPKDS